MAHDRFRVLRNRSTGHLPDGEITVAEALKARGYSTAMVGKWHLGVWSIDPAGHPRRHGFDSFLGLPHSNDMDPTPLAPGGAPGCADQDPGWWNAPLFRDEELKAQPVDQTQLTRLYTEEARRFIRSHKRSPFLLYVAHTFPHVPLFASGKYRGTSRRGLYGDVVEELDWSVGQILETLRREGLAKNTLVFFTSDNGPWLVMNQQGGSAGLLRDGKGSTWEGGMRVPGLAWWPGKIAGNIINTNVACMMDLFPTALRLAGAELPDDRILDGHDLTNTLLKGAPMPERPFFYYRGTQLYAVRLGQWKLHLLTQRGYGQPKADAHDPPLLFDLNLDPGERFNVATNHPAVITGLLRQIESHRATVAPVKSQLEEVRSTDERAKSNAERSAQRPAVDLPESTRVLRDLEYVPDGHERQRLDLYVPANATNLPLIVWVHGGAWLGGSKERPPALPFLKDGYAVASINYRLSQHATFPAQLEDCKAAIRWLRANAGKYGIDPDRIGVWGSSAGGHLVALLGCTGDVVDFDKGGNLDVSSRVQAVCDFFGPSDFLQMSKMPSDIDHDAPDSPEAKLIGGAVHENKDKAAQANPITYVSRDDPPFLILHGDQDRTVPINQSELLHDALRKAGVDSTFHVVKGAGHGFGGPEIQEMVRSFFAKHLKGRPAAVFRGRGTTAPTIALGGSWAVSSSKGNRWLPNEPNELRTSNFER
jgi:arylsulfatase A-like enzyme/dienelactone hydrolase